MLIQARRFSQALFCAFFLYLMVRTKSESGPVNLFLRIDPLAALTNAVSTGALYRGLAVSMAILIPTLFVGRFSCGWICPFGTLNHFFSPSSLAWRRGRGA